LKSLYQFWKVLVGGGSQIWKGFGKTMFFDIHVRS
jgi:hypothetical protein